jgi:hypothetical protein
MSASKANNNKIWTPATESSDSVEKLCVGMVDPRTFPRKGKHDLQLWAVTMTDPATCFVQNGQKMSTKHTDVAVNVMERTLLLLTHP